MLQTSRPAAIECIDLTEEPSLDVAAHVSKKDVSSIDALYASCAGHAEFSSLRQGAWLSDKVLTMLPTTLEDEPFLIVDSAVVRLLFSNVQRNDGLTEFEYGVLKLKRMLMKRKILGWSAPDTILAIVNHGNNNTHWNVVVFNIPSRTVTWFDSFAGSGLGSAHINIETRIRQALVEAAIDVEELMLQDLMMFPDSQLFPMCPQQSNGHDCGVFAFICVKYIATGRMSLISQLPPDLAHFRKLIFAEVVLRRSFV